MNAQSYPTDGNEKSHGVEDNGPAGKLVTENRGQTGYPRRVSRGEGIAIVLGRIEAGHLPWPTSAHQELETSGHCSGDDSGDSGQQDKVPSRFTAQPKGYDGDDKPQKPIPQVSPQDRYHSP
jgi:hypothetical protein